MDPLGRDVVAATLACEKERNGGVVGGEINVNRSGDSSLIRIFSSSRVGNSGSMMEIGSAVEQQIATTKFEHGF